MTYFARYWTTDPARCLLGGVQRSESSVFSHREDAESLLATALELNGPHAAGEIVESTRRAEIVRHCRENGIAQAVGAVCPHCKTLIRFS